jgi:nucleotide-binding universal stress UspA family protein
MTKLRTRDESGRQGLAEDPNRRDANVMLATLRGAPLGAESIRLAVAAAADGGARLMVVNVVDVAVGGRGPRIDIGDAPDLARSLHAAALSAALVGVPVTTVRVPTLHPTATLAALVANRRPALVVLGPDLERMSRLRHMSMRHYRRTVRVLERRTSCLLWTPSVERLAPAAPATPSGAPRGFIARWPPARPRLW